MASFSLHLSGDSGASCDSAKDAFEGDDADVDVDADADADTARRCNTAAANPCEGPAASDGLTGDDEADVDGVEWVEFGDHWRCGVEGALEVAGDMKDRWGVCWGVMGG